VIGRCGVAYLNRMASGNGFLVHAARSVRAAELYRARGDLRGEAESLFRVGCCHQVVRRDNDAAAPVLWRSLELATEAEDTMTMSEALRHLGIAEHAAGRLEAARLHLEESTRLRREIGAWPVGSGVVSGSGVGGFGVGGFGFGGSWPARDRLCAGRL
jgi:hypothetical protein